jgi:hypothetical protein
MRRHLGALCIGCDGGACSYLANLPRCAAFCSAIFVPREDGHLAAAAGRHEAALEDVAVRQGQVAALGALLKTHDAFSSRSLTSAWATATAATAFWEFGTSLRC